MRKRGEDRMVIRSLTSKINNYFCENDFKKNSKKLQLSQRSKNIRNFKKIMKKVKNIRDKKRVFKVMALMA